MVWFSFPSAHGGPDHRPGGIGAGCLGVGAVVVIVVVVVFVFSVAICLCACVLFAFCCQVVFSGWRLVAVALTVGDMKSSQASAKLSTHFGWTPWRPSMLNSAALARTKRNLAMALWHTTNIEGRHDV